MILVVSTLRRRERDDLHGSATLGFPSRCSPGQAATALLKDEHWSDDELDALMAEVERVKRERRS